MAVTRRGRKANDGGGSWFASLIRRHLRGRRRRILRDLLMFSRVSTSRRGIERPAHIGRGDRPVLLIYGFFQHRRILRILCERFKRDGFSVFTIHLGGLLNTFNTDGIPDLARLVSKEVEALCRDLGICRLAIVGHSEGGLVARYYVKRLGGHRRVTHLVTLGTPHHGTPVAYLGILALGVLARSVWQMTPMSPFIRELKRGRFPVASKLTSIYTKDDRVAPYPCCMLELKPGERTCNIEIAGVGHVMMLLNKRVYEIICSELLDRLNVRALSRRPGRGRLVAIEKAPPRPSSTRKAKRRPPSAPVAAPPARLRRTRVTKPSER
jgi:triacylglycerol lipase